MAIDKVLANELGTEVYGRISRKAPTCVSSPSFIFFLTIVHRQYLEVQQPSCDHETENRKVKACVLNVNTSREQKYDAALYPGLSVVVSVIIIIQIEIHVYGILQITINFTSLHSLSPFTSVG